MTIFGADVPFARLCRIEEAEATPEVTRLRMVPGPDHMNNLGLLHGGAICTLLDVAMGSAARLKAQRPVTTIDMQVAFLSAGRGPLTAEGRVIRKRDPKTAFYGRLERVSYQRPRLLTHGGGFPWRSFSDSFGAGDSRHAISG